jgi:hypothetical protein
MNSKDKAWQLLQTIECVYIMDVNYDPNKTKQCALICVDELIKEINKYQHENLADIQYWQEVQQEIEKL